LRYVAAVYVNEKRMHFVIKQSKETQLFPVN